MPLVHSFPPLENPTACVLILGSMPGAASLRAGQYYAHPHNAFWPIMGALLGIDSGSSYAVRTAALKTAGIALWDVLASCEREGSLDAAICHDSVVANDFPAFFRRHRHIADVLFNGGMAETCFRRHVASASGLPPLRLQRLPSTSPANASFSRARKLAAWRSALQERGIIMASR